MQDLGSLMDILGEDPWDHPVDIRPAIAALPWPGMLPLPWTTWTLIALVAYGRRKSWAHEVIEARVAPTWRGVGANRRRRQRGGEGRRRRPARVGVRPRRRHRRPDPSPHRRADPCRPPQRRELLLPLAVPRAHRGQPPARPGGASPRLPPPDRKGRGAGPRRAVGGGPAALELRRRFLPLRPASGPRPGRRGVPPRLGGPGPSPLACGPDRRLVRRPPGRRVGRRLALVALTGERAARTGGLRVGQLRGRVAVSGLDEPLLHALADVGARDLRAHLRRASRSRAMPPTRPWI